MVGNRYFNAVKEFMVRNNQFIREGADLPPHEVSILRIRLIVEELTELVNACVANDIVEIADACADSLYVIAGTAVAFGTDFVWSEDPMRGFASRQNNEYPKFVSTEKLYDHQLMMMRSLNDFVQGVHKDSVIDISVGLNNLGVAVLSIAVDDYNLPIDRVFDEVHRSNMTKAPLDKHQKGGKVTKEGYTPPRLKDVLNIS